MRLEFQRKSLDFNLDGSLRGTIVTLGHMDGGHLPVVLAGTYTVDQVPKRYREKVRELLELAEIGTTEEK
jgi:hypothetical protein